MFSTAGLFVSIVLFGTPGEDVIDRSRHEFPAPHARVELGRDVIRERIMAGPEHAKTQGTAVGWPRAVFDRAKILELRTEGKSWRTIAATLGVGIATVHRAFQTGVPKPISGEHAPRAARQGVAGD